MSLVALLCILSSMSMSFLRYDLIIALYRPRGTINPFSLLKTYNIRYISPNHSKNTNRSEEVPPIMAWEVEAALRKMKNGKEAGEDQVNIETLKAGYETIAKQLAKLYIKCITERPIPKTWKVANVVIFFKKGNRKDIKNYRPFCMLSNMYKLCTKIITTRLEMKLD